MHGARTHTWVEKGTGHQGDRVLRAAFGHLPPAWPCLPAGRHDHVHILDKKVEAAAEGLLAARPAAGSEGQDPWPSHPHPGPCPGGSPRLLATRSQEGEACVPRSPQTGPSRLRSPQPPVPWCSGLRRCRRALEGQSGWAECVRVARCVSLQAAGLLLRSHSGWSAAPGAPASRSLPKVVQQGAAATSATPSVLSGRGRRRGGSVEPRSCRSPAPPGPPSPAHTRVHTHQRDPGPPHRRAHTAPPLAAGTGFC